MIANLQADEGRFGIGIGAEERSNQESEWWKTWCPPGISDASSACWDSASQICSGCTRWLAGVIFELDQVTQEGCVRGGATGDFGTYPGVTSWTRGSRGSATLPRPSWLSLGRVLVGARAYMLLSQESQPNISSPSWISSIATLLFYSPYRRLLRLVRFCWVDGTEWVAGPRARHSRPAGMRRGLIGPFSGATEVPWSGTRFSRFSRSYIVFSWCPKRA